MKADAQRLTGYWKRSLDLNESPEILVVVDPKGVVRKKGKGRRRAKLIDISNLQLPDSAAT